MRNILPVLVATAIASAAWQQGHAQACFLSADFEDGTIPAGWTNSIVTVVSTGDPINAWTVGTAAQANANTFFPVVDMPIGNRFAMANDDAPPCDCTMDDVYLTTPELDLSSRTNVALESRVFHEMVLGGGEALIEASINGNDWTVLDTLDAIEGNWQNVFMDLSAFDGEALFQLRFHWSDGGNWASGFAVDDVCIRERNTTDLSVIAVHFGNDTASAFTLGDQEMRYAQLPLEQAGAIILSVEVLNRGTTTVQNIGANVAIDLDGAAQGTFTSATVIELAPGERGTLVIATGWSAIGTGIVHANVTTTQNGTDDDPSDNVGSASLRITGPSWDDGYSAMARDEGEVQGSKGSSLGFIAANRMEIVNEGSIAKGASAVVGVNSQVGEVIRMILMDGNFAFIDTTLRDTITQLDIDMAYGGAAIYLPFVSTPALAVGDYFVGFQRISGTGWVSVATSGNCPVGASAFMEGTTFDITWSTATPMVRLHLSDYGVGLAEIPSDTEVGLSVQPNPMDGSGRIVLRAATVGSTALHVFDAMGREVRSMRLGNIPKGTTCFDLDTSDLPSGTYTLQVVLPTGSQARRIVVAH